MFIKITPFNSYTFVLRYLLSFRSNFWIFVAVVWCFVCRNINIIFSGPWGLQITFTDSFNDCYAFQSWDKRLKFNGLCCWHAKAKKKKCLYEVIYITTTWSCAIRNSRPDTTHSINSIHLESASDVTVCFLKVSEYNNSDALPYFYSLLIILPQSDVGHNLKFWTVLSAILVLHKTFCTSTTVHLRMCMICIMALRQNFDLPKPENLFISRNVCSVSRVSCFIATPMPRWSSILPHSR